MTTDAATRPRIAVVRNEVDAERAFHCDALADVVAAAAPDTVEVDYPAGERPGLDDVDGVVLSGSSAGVYEAEEYPWMHDQQDLVRELVERQMPALGVCFGHQIANVALGGSVEADEMREGLVRAELADDEPIFEGVGPAVPVAHSDVVTDSGDGMDVIGCAPYYDAFATRHERTPLWSVQFHPEFTAEREAVLRDSYDWDADGFDFADVTASRVVENFAAIVAERVQVV